VCLLGRAQRLETGLSRHAKLAKEGSHLPLHCFLTGDFSEPSVSFKLLELLRLLVDAVGEDFLVEGQVGEALEDLLQGGLVGGVLRDVVLLFQFFSELEEESD